MIFMFTAASLVASGRLIFKLIVYYRFSIPDIFLLLLTLIDIFYYEYISYRHRFLPVFIFYFELAFPNNFI